MQRSDECISSFAEELLRAEEEKPSDPPNVLTSMVEALRTKTPLMTREVALNNIRLLIVASHETSGNVLAYALASLALRPELAEPVAREALQDTWLQASSLTELKNSLPRAREALEESLRMHPAFYATARRTTSDLEVETPQGKYFIPKDTDIALNLFAAQRDEAHWGEHKTGYSANEFAPQRWTAENATQRGLSDDDKDLFAFGMGSRVCIGAHMFWAEALPLIAQFMREFELLPQFKDTDSDMNGDLSLQSGQGYPVLLKIRKRG
jgi:cytochrome P450